MSTTLLPRTLDLRKPGMHRAHFEGSLGAADMRRLLGLLANDEGSVHASISSALDEAGRTVLSVSVTAELSVRCQRCLEVFQRQLQTDSALAIVRTDEQAAQLPEGLEPLLASQEVDLWAVVEDELVLAMPLYSYHEDESCIEHLAGRDYAAGTSQQEGGGDTEAERPFDVLAKLKRDP